MPLDESVVGRSYRGRGEYQVGREKIREFATAIGDTDPVLHDVEAARAAGYPDLIAPPTFAYVVTMSALDQLIGDPELGLALHRIVHGDQSFSHSRPVTAGDVLHAEMHVDKLRVVAGNDFLTLRCEITDSGGGPVSTAVSTLVHRGEPRDAQSGEPRDAQSGGDG